MIRESVLAIALSLVGGAPALAQAPPAEPSVTFRLFKDVCLNSDGDRMALIDAAGRNGFALRVGDRPQTIGGLTNAAFLPWSGNGPDTGLVIGWKRELLSCVITTKGGDRERIIREVEGWVGFPSDARFVNGNTTNFFFSETSEGRTAQWDATPEQQQALVAEGLFRIVWVSATNGTTTLSFSAPPKSYTPNPQGTE